MSCGSVGQTAHDDWAQLVSMATHEAEAVTWINQQMTSVVMVCAQLHLVLTSQDIFLLSIIYMRETGLNLQYDTVTWGTVHFN